MSPRLFIGAVAVAFAVAALVLFIASIVGARRARRARSQATQNATPWPPPMPAGDASDLDLSDLGATSHPQPEPSVLDRIEWWVPPGESHSSTDRVSPALDAAEGPVPASDPSTTAHAPVVSAPDPAGHPMAIVPDRVCAPRDEARPAKPPSDGLETLLATLGTPPEPAAVSGVVNAAVRDPRPRGASAAPLVELVLDGQRITVREGSATHGDFRRYADALLADLRECRRE